jgi:hypothetical protein
MNDLSGPLLTGETSVLLAVSSGFHQHCPFPIIESWKHGPLKRAAP